jgi:hypothetical protein
MVIHDFDVGRFAVPPCKADTVSVVDANAVLASPVALEGIEVQAGAFEIMQSGFRNRTEGTRPETMEDLLRLGKVVSCLKPRR